MTNGDTTDHECLGGISCLLGYLELSTRYHDIATYTRDGMFMRSNAIELIQLMTYAHPLIGLVLGGISCLIVHSGVTGIYWYYATYTRDAIGIRDASWLGNLFELMAYGKSDYRVVSGVSHVSGMDVIATGWNWYFATI